MGSAASQKMEPFSREEYLRYATYASIATPEEQEEFRNLKREKFLEVWNKEKDEHLLVERCRVEKQPYPNLVEGYRSMARQARAKIDGLDRANYYEIMADHIERDVRIGFTSAERYKFSRGYNAADNGCTVL